MFKSITMNQEESVIRACDSIEIQYDKDISYDLLKIIRHHLSLVWAAGYEEGKRKKDKMKTVIQTKDGVFIESYDSVVDAYKATGIGKCNIAKAARGEMKTAGGFTWNYKND